MKKITAIICIVFALVMILALPVGAATPYQTYTYSILGTALYSPDAYTPSKMVDATHMGLGDVATLHKLYPEMQELQDTVAESQILVDQLEAEMGKYGTESSQYAELKEQKSAAEKTLTTAKTKYDDMFESLSTISAPGDLEVDANENVYIADTGNNRIVVLDRYYKVKFVLSSFTNEQGIADQLNGPQGVFITPDKIVAGETVPGKIYVCDTNSNRIVLFSLDGEFLSIIPQPESQLFTSDAVYKPIAVAVDNYDRLYVVSSTTYQGIIVMTESGEFTGFVGAQKVSLSAWEQLWRRFQTEEQREQQESNVSTAFNNITLTGDFIYATIHIEDENQQLASLKNKKGDYSPVKMLNAAGDEIMRRNGFFGPSGEVDYTKSKTSDTIFGASTVVDVAVGPEKTWSIVDQKRSKVFTYDFDGNLLFAFGDMGRQLGNIPENSLSAIVYQGDKMLLLNKISSTFTVYNRTEYGDILIQALENQNNRQNDKAIEDWTEILKRNSNFDAAYIGIGNALYRSGKYEESLDYFMAAYDTENYSNSFKELRKEWISKYILLIPVFIFVICFAWIKLMGYAKKLNKRVSTTKGKRTYWQELMYVFHLMFHPFDGFWDLKHEKRGSVRGGTTILGLAILAFYYQNIGQGYILNSLGAYTSLFNVILSVVLPLALWIAANWCLTTLFEGEGSFKDIYIASTYSLMPLVLIMIPTTIASNFVLANEANILGLLNGFAFIWVGLLLFFGMMVTHDYTMGKNVFTTLGTLLGMICIMFIAILFTTLLGKLVSFVTNIVTEIQFRL